MIAQAMVARAVSVRRVAAQLGVDESTLRYRLRRPVEASDGRRERPTALAGWDERVDAVLARFDDARVVADGSGHCEAQMLHRLLAREHGFAGSYQAVRRYLRRRFPPGMQAVRRVETPPGVQAQHDWFDFDGRIGGERRPLHALLGTLSHCRAQFPWVSPAMTQLAWQTGHLEVFRRYGGVPLWIRLDNLKTAVAAGAGPTAVLNPAFARFARQCGFAIDPCRPATGSDKGKVERSVRTARSTFADLLGQDWPSLEALQTALDKRAAARHAHARCPVTGTTIAEALAAERALLQPVPALHEPFDCVVTRRVTRDGLVSFEGRRYSVPFAWITRRVEVRGTAQHVVILADHGEIAGIRGTPRHGCCSPRVITRARRRLRSEPRRRWDSARLQLAALPASPRLHRPLADYVTLLDAMRPTAGAR